MCLVLQFLLLFFLLLIYFNSELAIPSLSLSCFLLFLSVFMHVWCAVLDSEVERHKRIPPILLNFLHKVHEFNSIGIVFFFFSSIAFKKWKVKYRRAAQKNQQKRHAKKIGKSVCVGPQKECTNTNEPIYIWTKKKHKNELYGNSQWHLGLLLLFRSFYLCLSCLKTIVKPIAQQKKIKCSETHRNIYI